MSTPRRPTYRKKRSSNGMTCVTNQDPTFEPRAKRKRKSTMNPEIKIEIECAPRRGRSSSSNLKQSPNKLNYARYIFESAVDQQSSSNERSEFLREESNLAGAEIGKKTVRRRGRLPSSLPCPNQRAKLARENRRKKNEYIQKIETKLELLSKENEIFSDVIEKQKAEIRRLENEVVYLQSVLHDKNKIDGLLKSVNANLQKFRVAREEEESFKAIQGLGLYVHDSYACGREESYSDESTQLFDNLTPLNEIEMVDFSTLGSLFPNEELLLQNLESGVEFCPDMNP